MSEALQSIVLANGLTVVAEPNPGSHTAAAGFFVRTGCRDETPELMGVSHFLEHMMFKGTERRTAADVNREFDEIGANYNASTGQEVTSYWAHVLPDRLPHAIDLLADMMRPTLRDADFEMERNVILEEIGMYADRPFWVAYEQAMADRFGEHPLGYRILGTPETIQAMTPAQMRRYFERRYAANNLVVTLAGRFDFQACVRQIEEATAHWVPHEAGRDLSVIPTHAVEKQMTREGLAMHYILGVCGGPAEQDEDREAAEVLSDILGDSDGSRLHWALIDPGLADEVEISHEGFDHTGLTLFYASCRPDQADRVESILIDTLSAKGPEPTSAEVSRAIEKIATAISLRAERPAGRMMAMGSQWLYHGRCMTLIEEIDRSRAVTADAVRAVWHRMAFGDRSMVRLSPA